MNKGNTSGQLNRALPLFLALIAAGLAGNYLKFPIFLNIDFLFGSIFAMLALQFFGLGRGILSAAMIAGYTYVLWNHPYAMIILTVEVAAVGWLMDRRKMGMVLADTLYWLIIGMPLVYLSYHLVMHVSPGNTYIVMIIQAVNGIANALVARLLFTGYVLRTRKPIISYREVIYNLLAFFVLCPTFIILAIDTRIDFTENDLRMRTLLTQDVQQEALRIATWVTNRKSAILNLAEMAASKSPRQMQSYLEAAKKSDVNFQWVGLQDGEAPTAYFPLIEEREQSNIGKIIADSPFMPMLKQTLKPMLSEVDMGRVGTPTPTVLILAPVIRHGAYGGYAFGILGLEQVREHLHKSTDKNASLFTLLDKNGRVIMTNRPDQKVMTPFVRGKGTLTHLEAGIGQWVPVVPPHIPVAEQWKKSFYVVETAIGDLARWKLILEQPAAPFQKTLYDNYASKLTLLFLILLGALALAELLSRRSIVTLEKLRLITRDLPAKLASEASINWPESGIEESNALINNFREMADSLTAQFNDMRQIAEEIRESRQQLLDIIDFYPDATFVINNDKKVIVWNCAMEKMTGISKAEMIGQGDYAYTVPFYGERRKHLLDLLDEDNEDIEAKYHNEFRVDNILSAETFCPALYGGKGAFVWATGARLFNTMGVRVGAIESIRDVTDRKRAEEALIEKTAALREVTQRLQLATSSGGIGIWDWNIQSGVMIWDDRMFELYNIAKESFSQSVKAWEDALHPDDYGKAMEASQAALRGEQAFDTEFRILQPDGTVKHVKAEAIVIRDEDGMPFRMIGINRDITRRKQIQEKMRQQREELFHVSRLATIGEFAASIAHEINQPLTAILNNAQAAKRNLMWRMPDVEELRDTLEDIINDDKRAAEVIRNLRSIVKQKENERTSMDLSEAVEDVLKLLHGEISERNVMVTCHLSSSLPHVLGNRVELQQVLINLILNGCDAVRNVGPPDRRLIIQTLSDEAGGVVASVKDFGTGLDEKNLERVFDQFYTTKSEGLGMGLSISKSIIVAHGGRIWGANDPEGGAAFCFTLPIYKGKTLES